MVFLADRLSARGGADRHLLAVLDWLRDRAATCLLVGRDDGSLPEAERTRLGAWGLCPGLERAGLVARGGQAAARRLDQALTAAAPELIHLHNVMDPALISLAAARAPAVLTVQDHRFFCPGPGQVLPDGTPCGRVLGGHCLGCFREPDYGHRMLELTRTRLAALSGVRRILVLSPYMARQLAAAGVDRQKLVVAPPPVHGLTRPPGAKTRRGYHLLACRLVEAKGVRVALAAALEHRVGLPLVVAGDGPLAPEVAAAARAHPRRVRYVGWADRAEMARLLAGAASLWLPSRWAEPFGIVGLEALALGVPVVASRVGGVGAWLKAGRGGVLVPPGDAARLARAARELARRPAEARDWGRAGRRRVARDFAPPTLGARLWRIYGQALGEY